MSCPDPGTWWAEVSRRVEAETGLHFAPRQWRDMQRGLALAAARLGLADAPACARRLLAHALDPSQMQVLAECLAVGETYLFRDPAMFDALARDVLQPLVAARRATTRHLRLWSAGCSTGEEAYSLAMLVATLLPDWRDWNISILATDLNPAPLANARAGVYGRWSLRGGVPPAAHAYLRPLGGGQHEVDPQLRRLVSFAPLNFVRDEYPSSANGTTAMDLILCRNVLIYFEAARAQDVLRRLGNCLAGDGWLVTGSVELPVQAIAGLARQPVGGLTALRRPMALPPAAPLVPAFRCAPAPVAPSARPIAPAPATEPPPLEVAVVPQEARALADAGQLETAEQLCRAAMAADKLDAQWPWLLASILLEQGRTPEAVRALQRTLYLEPDHVLARFTLGSLALREGRRGAHKHLSRALSQIEARPADEVIEGSGGLSARELHSVILRMGGAA